MNHLLIQIVLLNLVTDYVVCSNTFYYYALFCADSQCVQSSTSSY